VRTLTVYVYALSAAAEGGFRLLLSLFLILPALPILLGHEHRLKME
jgi:hypothetical protein